MVRNRDNNVRFPVVPVHYFVSHTGASRHARPFTRLCTALHLLRLQYWQAVFLKGTQVRIRWLFGDILRQMETRAIQEAEAIVLK
ncbi:MAG: hypothetical protein BZY79_05655 [SAR202 cluster bacterium Casp-Chloro-G4]|nr:MAG: hypothetical protein BZY79_05655 [SAR202 cluster bacterium Casp-Chloro-G4]